MRNELISNEKEKSNKHFDVHCALRLSKFLITDGKKTII